MSGLRRDDGEWAGGALHDGASGRTYACKATSRTGRCFCAATSAFPRWDRPGCSIA
ncbi:DUF2147 domain-containing protein [Burkholderia cepacia]|uniref:DUF2147 domain-containing protein n=1 Tax=Burkholderia cepacia TaxID=292 RepID=UPI001E5A34BE|nr:DUF2147 domain-containing protein [Burkholderia cepacia]